ncbi:MAG: SUMF1/EgtB/PvdO family nonheme iron enzyme [Saprospiraceae bacterium]|nr:SUMF1/EgtB/PvdO family nonheme iron enzyme [Saprospiraceae bacterium]
MILLPEKSYRYPGVQPFSQGQQNIFFGRGADTVRLLSMILQEKLCVLYGKSGHGKSSLLQAGLIPALEDWSGKSKRRYQPIVFRFNTWTNSDAQSLYDKFVFRLDQAMEQAAIPRSSIKSPVLPKTLWGAFKQWTPDEKSGFVFIFDQFEEFFSYPLQQQLDFKQQLAELIYSDFPQYLEDNEDSLDSTKEAYLFEKTDVRVIFSIRSDRLSDLDRMKDHLPAILLKRYELEALDLEQAHEAITLPAAVGLEKQGGDQDAFFSPAFSYEKDALDKLLEELSGRQGAKEKGIEAFQLQMVCFSTEKRVIERHLNCVRAEDLPDFNTVYEDYYKGRIAELPGEEQAASRKVLEQGLLLIDPQTGSARRLSRDVGELAQAFQVPASLLENLERTYLIRRELNTLGGYSYEISHDTLIAPMLKARKEQEAAEIKENLHKEAQALEEREKKLRKRQRRNALAGFLAVLLLAFSIYAFFQAKQAEQKAREATKMAELHEKQSREAHELAQREAHNLGIARNLADSLSIIAKLKNEESEMERQKSSILYRSLYDEKEYKIALYINQAKDFIYQIKYDHATEQIKAALLTNAEGETINNILTELAFWYTETNQLDRAFGILDTLYKELNRPLFVPRNSRQAARSAIKTANPVLDSILQNRYYPVMIPIKGGRFRMGTDTNIIAKGRYAPDELPIHDVILSDFEISQTEVTFWQYNLYWMSTDRPGFEKGNTVPVDGKGDYPVNHVNWTNACLYANWLSTRFGYDTSIKLDKNNRHNILPQSDGIRLPSEAEWEYAVRGGVYVDTIVHAETNNISEIAWYAKNSGMRPQRVATKKPNSYGLFDMTGNLSEWVWDYYDKNYYKNFSETPATNPFGPESPNKQYAHVYKGGSYGDFWQNCRNSSRDAAENYPYNQIGFRVAKPRKQ